MNELKTAKNVLKRSQDLNKDILDAFKSMKSKINTMVNEIEEEKLRFNPEEINILDPGQMKMLVIKFMIN